MAQSLLVYHTSQQSCHETGVRNLRFDDVEKALEAADRYLFTMEEARWFVEVNMVDLVILLLLGDPTSMSRSACSLLDKCLEWTLKIVSRDLEFQTVKGNNSQLMLTLSEVFRRKTNYYKRRSNRLFLRMVTTFHRFGGVRRLKIHLIVMFRNPVEVAWINKWVDVLVPVLSALGDALPSCCDNGFINETLDFGTTILLLIERRLCHSIAETRAILCLTGSLSKLFDRLPIQHRMATTAFYSSWRSLTGKLFKCASMNAFDSSQMTVAAWCEVTKMIRAVYRPAQSYAVLGAGFEVVNGVYNIVEEVVDSAGYDGYGLKYQHCVVEGEDAGRVISLIRCRMTERDQKFWYITEADNMDPDSVYYRCRLPDQEFAPKDGWKCCTRSRVRGPPPQLVPMGTAVPAGLDYENMLTKLTIWIIENNLVQCNAFDGHVHSGPLLRFMTHMAERHLARTLSYQTLQTNGVDGFFRDPANLMWDGNITVFRDRLSRCKLSQEARFQSLERVLERVIKKTPPWVFISAIVELAPTLAGKLDSRSGFYLFQLAASMDEDLQTIFSLLRERPDVIRRRKAPPTAKIQHHL